MSDDLRRSPHQEHRLPDLPAHSPGNCRLALLVASSDLAEARHLAPDEDTREDIDSVIAQVNRISDDLAEQIDVEDGDPDA